MLNKTLNFEDIVTFTRNSTATYWDANGVLQTAAIDEPRFDHDPVTGEPLGILCEAGETNMLLWSTDLTKAIWTEGQVGFVPNVIEAPDATVTGGKVVPNNVAANFVFYQGGVNVLAGERYTFSIFVKAAEYSTFSLLVLDGPNPKADFDLASGTITNTQGGNFFNATIQELRDGWFRASLIWEAQEDEAVQVRFYDRDTGSRSGDGVSGIYIWQPQCERGQYPSSPILTEDAEVTRAGDFADVTSLSPWFNTQPEMTLLADWIQTPHGVNSATLMHALRKTAGITAGYFGFYSTMNGLVYTGAEPAQAISFGKGPLDFCKTGISVSGDTLVIGVNGDVRSYGGSTYSNVVNQEKIQLTANSNTGWLQNIRYHSRAMTEAEMIEELS